MHITEAQYTVTALKCWLKVKTFSLERHSTHIYKLIQIISSTCVKQIFKNLRCKMVLNLVQNLIIYTKNMIPFKNLKQYDEA